MRDSSFYYAGSKFVAHDDGDEVVIDGAGQGTELDYASAEREPWPNPGRVSRWFASVSEEIELVFVVGGDLEIMF